MTEGLLEAHPRLRDWILESHAFVMFDSPRQFMVGDAEVDYQVTIEDDGAFLVQTAIRGDRRPTFCSDNFQDVEKYLTFIFGPDIRSWNHLPSVVLYPIPIKREYLAPGFNLVGDKRNCTLSWQDESGQHTITHIDEFDAIDFSLYQHLSIPELQELFRNPEGAVSAASDG